MRARWALRLLIAEVMHLARRVGYWVRPYDMPTDSRVWRNRRTVCQPMRVVNGRIVPGRWTK